MARTIVVLACAASVLGASGGTARAATWQITRTLLPGSEFSDPDIVFGSSVSLLGEDVLVNGELFSVASGGAGRLFTPGVMVALSHSRAIVNGTLFDRTSGATVAAQDHSGPSAIDETHWVMGNPISAIWTWGTAAVYDPVTGALVRDLPNPDPHVYDPFGVEVGLSGTHAMVGKWGGAGGDFVTVFDVESGEVLRTLHRAMILE